MLAVRVPMSDARRRLGVGNSAGHRGGITTDIIERLCPDRLVDIVRGTSRTQGTWHGRAMRSPSIFRDRDEDDLAVTVVQPFRPTVDHHRVHQRRGPTDLAIEASNNWNGDIGGSTSALLAGDNNEIPVLQAHLTLEGAVTEANAHAWLSDFLASINEWERAIEDAMSETPTRQRVDRGRLLGVRQHRAGPPRWPVTSKPEANAAEAATVRPAVFQPI